MKTSYPGLDYSGPASTVNRDPVTGIRYGIISLRSLGEFAFEDIEQHGIDQDFEEFQQRIKAEIDSALRPVLKDYVLSSRIDKLIENAQDDALEEASDCYQQPSDWIRYHYEHDGCVLQVTGDGNLFVIKSPFVTNAQFCSPCVPGRAIWTLRAPMNLSVMRSASIGSTRIIPAPTSRARSKPDNLGGLPIEAAPPEKKPAARKGCLNPKESPHERTSNH